MKERGYQHDFSVANSAMYEYEGRERKARTLIAVLGDALGERLRTASVVNVGCSTGIMDSFIAPHVGSHLGIDIDQSAVDFANATHVQPNLSFHVGDAMAIGLDDASCDVVICSQVYEHVPDPQQLMREIERILAPGGVCYFAATNRLCIIEQHYMLPFLSIVPVWMAHRYLRVLGRGKFYYERHLSYWGLRKLVRAFDMKDYTRRVIEEPARFHTGYLVGSGKVKLSLMRTFLRLAYWAFPGYLWVLRRR